MTNAVETYKNEDGKIAVLVSPGYGAGWSTWYVNKNIAWDKRIIDYIFDHGGIEKFTNSILGTHAGVPAYKEFKKFLESIGYPDVYLGGADNLVIEWVDPGIYITIDEYDGNETLDILNVEEDYWKLT